MRKVSRFRVSRFHHSLFIGFGVTSFADGSIYPYKFQVTADVVLWSVSIGVFEFKTNSNSR